MAKRIYEEDGYLINYKEGDQSIERLPVIYLVGINSKLYIIVQDDTLQSIANAFYGTSESWFIIADANEIFNPFELIIGDTLIIPNNTLV